MQTLGISDTTTRSESRLKSLLWPSVENATDVDYLGSQGYWTCAAVGVFSFAVLAMLGQPIMALIVLLYFFLGGVGVREHSFYAAVMVFAMFVADLFFSSPSILKILLSAILLSNVRATWIASRWKAESDEAVVPPRLNTTLADKFADQLPKWLWPKVRIAYYIFAAALFALTVLGLILINRRRI